MLKLFGTGLFTVFFLPVSLMYAQHPKGFPNYIEQLGKIKGQSD